QDASAAYQVNLLPGRHFLTTYGGDPVYFSVAANGAVTVDPALEGVLSGGAHALTVLGHDVAIDARALGSASVYLDYAAYDAAVSPGARLLAGQHWIYTAAYSYVYFKVTADGRIDYDAALDGILSGRGTRTLTFRSLP